MWWLMCLCVLSTCHPHHQGWGLYGVLGHSHCPVAHQLSVSGVLQPGVLPTALTRRRRSEVSAMTINAAWSNYIAASGCPADHGLLHKGLYCLQLHREEICFCMQRSFKTDSYLWNMKMLPFCSVNQAITFIWHQNPGDMVLSEINQEVQGWQSICILWICGQMTPKVKLSSGLPSNAGLLQASKSNPISSSWNWRWCLLMPGPLCFPLYEVCAA